MEKESALTLTENYSLTFSTSNDARLDLFFHLVEGSDRERTNELVEKSWAKYPLDTMKLIMNCRDIRNGKGIRTQSLLALHWLYKNKFNNLLLNLQHFDHYGCWKDYLNLLLMVLVDGASHDSEVGIPTTCFKSKTIFVTNLDTAILKSMTKAQRRELELIETDCYHVERKVKDEHGKSWIRTIVTKNELDDKKIVYKSKEKYFPKIKFSPNILYKFKTNKAKLKKLNEYRLKYFENKYQNDSNFKILYDRVVDCFAKQIHQDYQHFKRNEFDKLSLAAKWMPNHGRYFDKYLFILGEIAGKFFKLEPEALNVIEPEKRTLKKYHSITFSKICTNLRRKIHVPEILMSDRKWNEIDYGKVPSRAMLRYRLAFIDKDYQRFDQFVNTKALKAGAITPAEIVEQMLTSMFGEDDWYFDTEEKYQNLSPEQITNFNALGNQWKSLVDEVKSNGSIIHKNALAICDISGSMMYSDNKIKPMHAAVGLSLFLLELSDSVWQNCMITFSQEPEFHYIKPESSIKDRISQVFQAKFGLNTNLNAVFTLILNRAKEERLTSEKMPRLLFIFSDMEFDEALSEKTNFEAMKIQYDNAGYEMPFVIFWNLKGNKKSRSTPVQFDQNGVILLSGYSAQTFKFLFSVTNFYELSPIKMLMHVVNNPLYDRVQVVNEE